MLRIRLQRRGKRNQPFFRIIVTDKKNPPKGGRSLEMLGFLNPLTKEKQLKIERIIYWLSAGAQPSDRVHNLLVSEGIIKGKKKPVHAKPKKKEGEEEKPVAAPTEAKSEEKKEVKPEPASAEATAGKEEKPAEKLKDKKEDKKEEKKTPDAKPAEKPATETPKEESKLEKSTEKKEESKSEEKKE